MVPVADHEGDVQLVLGLDLLGLDRAFTDTEVSLAQELAASITETVHRIELGYAKLNYESVEALTAKAAEVEAETPTCVEQAVAADPENPMAELKAKVDCCTKLFAELTADTHLKFLKTRKECKPDVLTALKVVLYLMTRVEATRAKIGALTWKDLKACIESGEVTWDDLFKSISELDIMASTDAAGFEGAFALLPGPEDPPLDLELIKKESLITSLLFDWSKTAKALADQLATSFNLEALLETVCTEGRIRRASFTTS